VIADAHCCQAWPSWVAAPAAVPIAAITRLTPACLALLGLGLRGSARSSIVSTFVQALTEAARDPPALLVISVRPTRPGMSRTRGRLHGPKGY
jgi:hypothetical protein